MAFKQKNVFVNPFYQEGVGRRTGIQLKQDVRKDSDGFELFDDYWSESENESTLNITAALIGKENKNGARPQGKKSSLHSMPSFSPHVSSAESAESEVEERGEETQDPSVAAEDTSINECDLTGSVVKGPANSLEPSSAISKFKTRQSYHSNSQRLVPLSQSKPRISLKLSALTIWSVLTMFMKRPPDMPRLRFSTHGSNGSSEDSPVREGGAGGGRGAGDATKETQFTRQAGEGEGDGREGGGEKEGLMEQGSQVSSSSSQQPMSSSQATSSQPISSHLMSSQSGSDDSSSSEGTLHAPSSQSEASQAELSEEDVENGPEPAEHEASSEESRDTKEASLIEMQRPLLAEHQALTSKQPSHQQSEPSPQRAQPVPCQRQASPLTDHIAEVDAVEETAQPSRQEDNAVQPRRRSTRQSTRGQVQAQEQMPPISSRGKPADQSFRRPSPHQDQQEDRSKESSGTLTTQGDAAAQQTRRMSTRRSTRGQADAAPKEGGDGSIQEPTRKSRKSIQETRKESGVNQESASIKNIGGTIREPLKSKRQSIRQADTAPEQNREGSILEPQKRQRKSLQKAGADSDINQRSLNAVLHEKADGSILEQQNKKRKSAQHASIASKANKDESIHELQKRQRKTIQETRRESAVKQQIVEEDEAKEDTRDKEDNGLEPTPDTTRDTHLLDATTTDEGNIFLTLRASKSNKMRGSSESDNDMYVLESDSDSEISPHPKLRLDNQKQTKENKKDSRTKTTKQESIVSVKSKKQTKLKTSANAEVNASTDESKAKRSKRGRAPKRDPTDMSTAGSQATQSKRDELDSTDAAVDTSIAESKAKRSKRGRRGKRDNKDAKIDETVSGDGDSAAGSAERLGRGKRRGRGRGNHASSYSDICAVDSQPSSDKRAPSSSPQEARRGGKASRRGAPRPDSDVSHKHSAARTSPKEAAKQTKKKREAKTRNERKTTSSPSSEDEVLVSVDTVEEWPSKSSSRRQSSVHFGTRDMISAEGDISVHRIGGSSTSSEGRPESQEEGSVPTAATPGKRGRKSQTRQGTPGPGRPRERGQVALSSSVGSSSTAEEDSDAMQDGSGRRKKGERKRNTKRRSPKTASPLEESEDGPPGAKKSKSRKKGKTVPTASTEERGESSDVSSAENHAVHAVMDFLESYDNPAVAVPINRRHIRQTPEGAAAGAGSSLSDVVGSAPRSILKKSKPARKKAEAIKKHSLVMMDAPQPKAYIIPPEQEAGVRRTKRQRVRPLDYWRNERALYERRKSGGFALTGIVSPEMPGKSMREKPARQGAHKKVKDGLPRTPANISMHASPPPGAQPITQSGVITLNPETQEEVVIDAVAAGKQLCFSGPSGMPAKAEDPITISKALNQKAFSAGVLTVRPLEEKGAQLVRRDTIVFLVVRGKVVITIHQTSHILQNGDWFFVPKGNAYNIKNLRKDEARLAFFQLKGQ